MSTQAEIRDLLRPYVERHPDLVLIVQGESQMENFEQLREKYCIQFMFSSGLPPLDPGYAWHSRMTAPAGSLDELWFGELKNAGCESQSIVRNRVVRLP